MLKAARRISNHSWSPDGNAGRTTKGRQGGVVVHPQAGRMIRHAAYVKCVAPGLLATEMTRLMWSQFSKGFPRRLRRLRMWRRPWLSWRDTAAQYWQVLQVDGDVE